MQRRMVEFYNITHAERKGVLNFVLKMDECEILNEEKIERVAITLMDRAMVNMPKNDPVYFYVQSEMSHWWHGFFLVCSLNPSMPYVHLVTIFLDVIGLISLSWCRF